MIKQALTPAQIVKFLNQLLEIDPSTITELFLHRVACNKKLADHKTVQVVGHPPKGLNPDVPANAKFGVGVLGVLNGAFGVISTGKYKGCGCLAMEINDKTKKPVKFIRLREGVR